MKKIITTITLLLGFTLCKAQLVEQTIIPLENLRGQSAGNVYYKDVHNLLNPFVGTWLYTNGTTSLKLVLRKIIGHDNDYNIKDILVGEYEYIENGVSKHYKKDAVKYIKEYVKYQVEENNLTIFAEEALQQLLFEVTDVPFPTPKDYKFKFIDFSVRFK